MKPIHFCPQKWRVVVRTWFIECHALGCKTSMPPTRVSTLATVGLHWITYCWTMGSSFQIKLQDKTGHVFIVFCIYSIDLLTTLSAWLTASPWLNRLATKRFGDYRELLICGHLIQMHGISLKLIGYLLNPQNACCNQQYRAGLSIPLGPELGP